MSYCSHCRVHVRGEDSSCPLCLNTLPDSRGERGEPIFPEIPPRIEKKILMKIMLFISIIVLVAALFIWRLIEDAPFSWIVTTLLGIVTFWLWMIFVMRRRIHMQKRITGALFIVAALSVFWDWKIGWRGWSVDYVIPVACMISLLALAVIGRVFRLPWSDYLTYLLIVCIFGLVLSLFLLFDVVNVIYPTLLCIACCAISLAGLLIFRGEEILFELQKRMHV